MPNVEDLTRGEPPETTEPGAAGPSSTAPPAADSVTEEHGDDLELPDMTTDVPLRARAG